MLISSLILEHTGAQDKACMLWCYIGLEGIKETTLCVESASRKYAMYSHLAKVGIHLLCRVTVNLMQPFQQYTVTAKAFSTKNGIYSTIFYIVFTFHILRIDRKCKQLKDLNLCPAQVLPIPYTKIEYVHNNLSKAKASDFLAWFDMQYHAIGWSLGTLPSLLKVSRAELTKSWLQKKVGKLRGYRPQVEVSIGSFVFGSRWVILVEDASHCWRQPFVWAPRK